MYISSSPVKSEMNAIYFPLGDQFALRSCDAELAYTGRTGPFLAGTVKISPLVTNTALFPSAPRSQFSINSFPAIYLFLPDAKSSDKVILTFCARSFDASSL